MAKDNTPARENLLSARSLRYLHEIDLHGGVRAAADALAINGSVISRQVAHSNAITAWCCWSGAAGARC
ncbi:helix-turn-helix domain-containing protein [Caballeronia udeis]|nr:LysR family transcriptional regulator [Caballeronia udeis]